MAIYINVHRILNVLVVLTSSACISECFLEKVGIPPTRGYVPQHSAQIKPSSPEVPDKRGYCNGFICEDNKCLPEEYVCDGESDCSGGEDEFACNLNTCNDDQFNCITGDCIERSWACDMVKDCPNGDDEDESLCDNRQCTAHEFKCQSGSCIDIEWKCDGQYDCYHSDDEVNCKTCTSQQFKCSDDTCIAESAVCNGYADCYGGEDEHQWCACGTGEFKCDSGICIPHDKVCDGKKDCGYSGEDEHDCESCDTDQYRCNGNGKCIPNSFLCDGLVEDCPSGDDEANCGCTTEQFECSDGTCVALSLVCDGTIHCSDDETTFCECADLEFDCNSQTTRVCLPASQACDGIPQCPNGEDEDGCPFTCAPPDGFLCPDGSCLSASVKCNGVYDCDHSIADEVGCECTADQFKCLSGECLANHYVCDSYRDCKDGSDEFDEHCAPPEPIIGECPHIPAGTIGLCIYGCDSDDDCQHEKKCCFNGCGKECVHPIFPPEPFVKEGDCPVLSAPYGAHACTDLCLTDSDCPHLEKCCSNTCGKVCAEPFTANNEVEEINTDELEEELQQVKGQLTSLDNRFDWLETTVSDILVELGILQTEITDLKNHEHYETPSVHYHPPPAYYESTTEEPETPAVQNVVNGNPTNTGSRPGYQHTSHGHDEKPSNAHANPGRPTKTHSHRPYKKESKLSNNESSGEFKRMISHWGELLRSNDKI